MFLLIVLKNKPQIFWFLQPFVLFIAAQYENQFLSFVIDHAAASSVKRVPFSTSKQIIELLQNLMFTVRDYTTQTDWIIDFLILQSNGRSWRGANRHTNTTVTVVLSCVCNVLLPFSPHALHLRALFAFIL